MQKKTLDIRLPCKGKARSLAAALLAAVMCTLSTNVRAQEIISKQDMLAVLDGVYVIGGDVDAVLAAGGLTKEDILFTTTVDLAGAGVPVLDEEQWLMLESAPVLYVDLQSRQSSGHEPVYSIRVEVLYVAYPVADPTVKSYAMIWGDGQAGVYDASGKQSVMKDLRTLIAHFLADYREARSF